MDTGQKRLQELGYKQELRRSLSLFSNFALTFSVLSILNGVTTTYNTGLAYGGPFAIVYGWITVSFFGLCIALCMAEICSAYPTSGGLYFWSFRLAGQRWGPFASWLTGWFNLFGLWAATTSVNFSLAILLQVIIMLTTGYHASKYVVLGFHGVFLVLCGFLNSLEIKWVSRLATAAAFLNFIGVCVLAVLLPEVSPTRRSAEFVFTYFYDDNGSGIHNKAYIFFVGLLMSQYSLLGYDCSAHMSEETKSSDRNASIGIISSIASAIVVGFVYLLAITFVIGDISKVLDTSNRSRGYAVAQIFYDAFKARYGSGTGGIICLAVVAAAIWLCGVGCVTATSRMTFAFSRDGAIPGWKLWNRVNKHEVPVNAVWLAVTAGFCMALPSLGSMVAFQAMVSIATIATVIAYVLPTFFRITVARKHFKPGPFSLSRWSQVIGWIVVAWAVFITGLFCLPTVYPVTIQTLNYTPVAIGGVTLFIVGYWVLGARYWFKGPVSNFNLEEP